MMMIMTMWMETVKVRVEKFQEFKKWRMNIFISFDLTSSMGQRDDRIDHAGNFFRLKIGMSKCIVGF